MNKYNTPKIEFKNLCIKENISATCWGFTASNQDSNTLYWDVPGQGYISFRLIDPEGENKSCTDGPYPVEIMYYSDKNSTGVDGSGYKDQLVDALKKMPGGGNAQNYGGLGTYFPENPGGMS